MAELHKPRGRRPREGINLTQADLIVLSLLEERPMHGYDLQSEYDRQEVVDWASVSKAQVYYALDKLERRHLIKGRIEEGISRDRIVYTTTDKGRKELREALAQPAWAASRVAQPFATWIGLSIHVDKKTRTRQLIARQVFLNQEIERETASLLYIKTLISDRAKSGRAIVSLVIKQLEAELIWIGKLLRDDLGD
jgi:DNA-binding PadR family transcriptional regulator